MVAIFLSYNAAFAWQLDIDSGIKCPADQVFDSDFAQAVAVDQGGNIVAGGRIGIQVYPNYEPGDECGVFAGFAVTKIGPLGNKLWQFLIDGPELVGNVNAVATDSAGNVIAAGRLFNVNSEEQFFTVVKLDPSGSEIWQKRYTGTAGSGDAAAVVADNNDNIVAVGRLSNSGTSSDFVVIKWNPSGDELWRAVVDGSESNFDEATAVAVDAEGVIVAAGRLRMSGEGNNFAVIEFDSDGHEDWRVFRDRGSNNSEGATAVKFDNFDEVIAAGYLHDLTGDFGVVKIGTDGCEIWEYFLNELGGQQANALAINSQNEIVVAGRSLSNAPGPNNDFTVLKLDSDGNIEWQTKVAGSAGAADECKSVVVDANDDIVATGYVQANSPLGSIQEFHLLKLASVGGGIIWQRVVDGTAEEPNPAGVRGDGYAAAVDLWGNAIAVGLVVNSETLEDFTVVKQNGVDGSDYDPIGDLLGYVISQDFTSGIENSLRGILNAALKKLEDGNPSNDDAMVSNLRGFIARVEAQRGKKISDEQADYMVGSAEDIIAIYDAADVLSNH